MRKTKTETRGRQRLRYVGDIVKDTGMWKTRQGHRHVKDKDRDMWRIKATTKTRGRQRQGHRYLKDKHKEKDTRQVHFSDWDKLLYTTRMFTKTKTYWVVEEAD